MCQVQDYALDEAIYMTFWKRQRYRNKKSSGISRGGGGADSTAA